MLLEEQCATPSSRAFERYRNAIDPAPYHKHLVTLCQRRPLFQGKVHLLALDALLGHSIGPNGPILQTQSPAATSAREDDRGAVR